MYSSSINSKYINEKSTAFYRNPNDSTKNLAHELGHYLGLHHVFAEDKNGYADNCNDTDYCQDTPSYNRNKYNVWYLIQRQATCVVPLRKVCSIYHSVRLNALIKLKNLHSNQKESKFFARFSIEEF